jgi:predicted nucleotidyltransferase
MTARTASPVADLPAPVEQALGAFLDASREAFGPALRSVALYGSAAEGRLRATSDVNVLLVLSSFEKEAVDRLREPLRVAAAMVRLEPMFVLESELEAAASAFASKFADIKRRRRILHGDDPFAGLEVPRHAEIARLEQELLNLTLRMRALYAERSLREEQLALVVADMAGPLRAAAAALLELEGKPAASPKQALEAVAGSLAPDFADALATLSNAREKRTLPAGVAGPTLFQLMDLARRMRPRVEALG